MGGGEEGVETGGGRGVIRMGGAEKERATSLREEATFRRREKQKQNTREN